MKSATTLILPALTISQSAPKYTEEKLRVSLDNSISIGDPIAELHVRAPLNQVSKLTGTGATETGKRMI